MLRAPPTVNPAAKIAVNSKIEIRGGVDRVRAVGKQRVKAQ